MLVLGNIMILILESTSFYQVGVYYTSFMRISENIVIKRIEICTTQPNDLE